MKRCAFFSRADCAKANAAVMVACTTMACGPSGSPVVADAGDGSSSSDAALVFETGPGPGPAPMHAYVANYEVGASKSIAVYALPLTSTSAPVTVLKSGVAWPSSVRVEPGGKRIWVSDDARVVAFDLPLTETSQPVVAMAGPGGAVRDLAFDSKGNLWAVGGTTDGRVYEWLPPFVSGAMPALMLSLQIDSDAIGIDGNDNVYVGEGNAGGILVYPAPVTATSTHVRNPGVINGAQGFLFFGNVGLASNADGQIAVLELPVAATSGVLGTLGNVAKPFRMALDGQGNLAVADQTKGIVVLAAPTFTTISTTVTMGTSRASGIAFGP